MQRAEAVLIDYDAALVASRGGRRYQEDTALLWPAGGGGGSGIAALPDAPAGELVAVLGDGMGGHVGGAIASQLACEVFLRTIAAAAGEMPARLASALEATNRALADKIAAQPMMRGMGTTLIGTHLGADGLHWISVGDSLLYLWRRGEIARLNADHSLAPELDRMVAAGRLTREQADHDPRRHYLQAAVTGEEIEMIDLAPKPLELFAGDVVIIASDGLHTLPDARISSVIAEAVAGGARRIAATLVGDVEAAGLHAQDNTTVIAVTAR